MDNIKLGSICLTKVDKTFDSAEGLCFIKRGTFVTVCDDTSIEQGYVLVESEGFDTVFEYDIKELALLKNTM